MHMRSEAASAPANAQQHPQLDWSRTSDMILAQWGQWVAESNVSGMVVSVCVLGVDEMSRISPRDTRCDTEAVGLESTPRREAEAPGGEEAKRGWGAACQRMLGVRRIVSIWAARSGWTWSSVLANIGMMAAMAVTGDSSVFIFTYQARDGVVCCSWPGRKVCGQGS